MEKSKHMPTPTYVVGRKDFKALAYGRVMTYTIHGRRGLRVVPDTAQEIGENRVVFPEAPKSIVFRRRFSRERVERDVYYIEADNSDRFDLVFIIHLK